MLNLFCHFLISIFRLTVWTFWVVGLGFTTSSVSATDCNSSPVFAFSHALYLEQYEKARAWLPVIERTRSPETAQFMQQVLIFKRAYDERNATAQQAALDEIDFLIASMSRQPLPKNDSSNQLTSANIMIHAARMQLAVGHVLRATALAKEGKRLLDKVLERNPHNTDALLANGLYYYYAGSEGETLGWLLDLLSLEGDTERGRDMLEMAVERSPDHAFEAARSLVSDVAWNRQDTCRYLPLLEEQESPAILSITHRQQLIAIRLFCGREQYALDQLTRLDKLLARSGTVLSKEQEDWLFEARLHAMAAQGDVEQLNIILAGLSTQVQPRYWQVQFALAKALDSSGAHEPAVNLYQKVLASAADDVYKKLARAYVQLPYQKPRSFDFESVGGMQFACGG